jgi:DnaJ-domain-containing protein 1
MGDKLDNIVRETLQVRRRLSEFDLIKLLEQHQLLPEAEGSAELVLFQKHFIVRNALYRWQQELLGSKETLDLGLSEIELRSLGDASHSLPELDKGTESLAEFYLDWQNFESHGEGEVEGLLHSFWRDFARYQTVATEEVERALSVLGLRLPVTLDELKKQYKQLAHRQHPDRGGVSEEFVRISEAYQTVRLYLAK